MSLGQALREGSNALVARSLNEGGRRVRILRLLADRFSYLTPAEAREAYARGLQAWQAASQFQLFEPQYPITRAQIPSSGGLPHGYTFYVNVEVADPTTGQTFGTSVQLDFSSIPSKEAFEGALEQYMLETYGEESELPQTTLPFVNPELTNYDVYAVELMH